MVIAIDIGGSKYLLAAMDVQGKLHHIRHHTFDAKTGFEHFKEQLFTNLQAIIQETGIENITGIGLAVPGPTDPETGMLLVAPYSGWKKIPFRALIEESFSLPVFVENDVNASALAEKHFGHCRGVLHYAWITLSNGIGGALVLNGQLYRGAHGFAGEFGHFVVDPYGPRCGCGNYGCLEITAGAAAIAQRVQAHCAYNTELAALYPQKSPREIVIRTFELVREGNRIATDIIEYTGMAIGEALSGVINMFDPAMIIFGGGMALSLDVLLPYIKSVTQRRVMPVLQPHIQIKTTALGYYAALIGAGCLALPSTQKEN